MAILTLALLQLYDTALSVQLDLLMLHARVRIDRHLGIAGMQLPQLGDDVLPLIVEERAGAVVVPQIAGQVLRVDDHVGLPGATASAARTGIHAPGGEVELR